MHTPESNSSTFARGYTIAFSSAVILSTTVIIIRYLTETFQIPALVLAFWRDLFVSLTLLVIMAVFHRDLFNLKLNLVAYLMLYGLVLAVFNSLWTISVVLNGAAIATILAYTSGGFTALLGWLFLKESLGWVKVTAVLISFTGCVLVSGVLDPTDWILNPVGILTGISSGLGYATYTLFGRSASNRGLNNWSTLFYTFTFATLFLLLFNWLPSTNIPEKARNLSELFWLEDNVKGWLLLFGLAAGPTLAGFGLYNLSLNFLPSSIANLILTTELVFASGIAYLLLNERLDGIQISGSILIMISVVFLRYRNTIPKVN